MNMEKRIHTIPLRREFNKVSRPKRAEKAVKALKDYVMKHYRTGNVRIGKDLNERLWSRGIKNPPAKVKVVALKKDDLVELFLEESYKEEKTEKKEEKPVTAQKGEVKEKKKVKK